MKTFIKTLAVGFAGLFITASCSQEHLELVNPNALTSESAYNFEADINTGLTGIYHMFNGGYYSLNLTTMFSGQSDLALSYSPDTGLVDFVSFKYPDYSRGWNSCTWNELYAQIARCNQVITYSDKVEKWEVYEKEQILAQAKAIRAFAYYQLTMFYKKAPYVDYVAPPGDQPSESTFDFLCEKIIEDAQYAYETLPADYKSGPWANQYRVTKWFAAVILGKTYMNWNAQYSKALPYYQDIVNNGKSVGGEKLALVPDVLWNTNTANENNCESIFEIQNAQTVQSAGSYWAALGWGANNGASPDRGNWRWKFLAASPVGWGDYDAEAWLLHAFKNEKTVKNTARTTAGQWDPRLECSLLYYGIFEDYPGHKQWQWEEWNDANWAGARTDGRAFINKYSNWFGGDYIATIKDEEPTNYRIFRLGEVMLDYAECLANTGDLAGAIAQIDKVRDRSGLATLADREPVEAKFTNTLTGKELDMNADYGYAAIKSGNYTLADVMSVIDIEDAKETCFESDRTVDLRRWGVGDMSGNFYKKVAARSSKYDKNFAPHKVWMPIPNGEVNNNPNLTQVEGY